MNEYYDHKDIESFAQKHGKKKIAFMLLMIQTSLNIIVFNVSLSLRKLHMGHVRNYTIGDVVSRLKDCKDLMSSAYGMGLIWIAC